MNDHKRYKSDWAARGTELEPFRREDIEGLADTCACALALVIAAGLVVTGLMLSRAVEERH